MYGSPLNRVISGQQTRSPRRSQGCTRRAAKVVPRPRGKLCASWRAFFADTAEADTQRIRSSPVFAEARETGPVQLAGLYECAIINANVYV